MNVSKNWSAKVGIFVIIQAILFKILSLPFNYKNLWEKATKEQQREKGTGLPMAIPGLKMVNQSLNPRNQSKSRI